MSESPAPAAKADSDTERALRFELELANLKDVALWSASAMECARNQIQQVLDQLTKEPKDDRGRMNFKTEKKILDLLYAQNVLQGAQHLLAKQTKTKTWEQLIDLDQL